MVEGKYCGYCLQKVIKGIKGFTTARVSKEFYCTNNSIDSDEKHYRYKALDGSVGGELYDTKLKDREQCFIPTANIFDENGESFFKCPNTSGDLKVKL
jgi:hypothetical protein